MFRPTGILPKHSLTWLSKSRAVFTALASAATHKAAVLRWSVLDLINVWQAACAAIKPRFGPGGGEYRRMQSSNDVGGSSPQAATISMVPTTNANFPAHLRLRITHTSPASHTSARSSRNSRFKCVILGKIG